VQMALITTEEVINALQKNIGYTQCSIDLDYWTDVKKSIESQL